MALSRVLLINEQPGSDFSSPLSDKLPYRICMAESLSQGLAQFDMFRPEVVVLDMNAPNGPGMDAFRALRARGPICPLLLLTSEAAAETAREAVKEGAFSYMVKPVDPAQLCEQIMLALSASQAQTAVVSLLEVEAAAPSLGADLRLLIAYLQKDGAANIYARTLSAVDRVVLTEILRQTRGNQQWASELLGIDRKTLRQKLQNLDMLPVKPQATPKRNPASTAKTANARNGETVAVGMASETNGWQAGDTETE